VSAVSIIPADRNLIEEIRGLLVPDGNDFSANVVVFPGKRPAHVLRKAIADTMNGSFIPPRIFSIDHFIDHICAEKMNLKNATLETIDAVALLYEIHAAASNRVGGEHFASLDSFLPLGVKIFGELEELWIANIPQLKIHDALSGITFGELTSLMVLYDQFYALAQQRNFATRAMKYRMVADAIGTIRFENWRKIVLAGFFGFTSSEKTIFKHLLARDEVIQIFQDGAGLGRQMEELGVTAELLASSNRRPDLHFYRSADTHGQVFGLSGKIDELISKEKKIDDRTAIVLPAAETLFPVVHQTLALLPDDGFNISLGYPVTRTPVYGFLETLMELLASKYESKYSASQYIKFILHPYTKNILFGKRSDVTRILFNTVEELFIKEYAVAYFSLEDLETNSSLFDRASKRLAGLGEDIKPETLCDHLKKIHSSTIRNFDAVENIGSFASKAIEVLNFIYARSTAQAHPFFRPFAETLIESLDKISSSLLHDKKFSEFINYASFIRNYIAAVEVPFTGTPLHGLQVLGFLETRNLQFDRVYFLDANDDILPGNKGHDVLLSLKVREALGISTYRDREHVAEYYFDILLKGAKEVHFFFLQEGKKEKSRFIEKLLWEYQQRDKKTDPDDYIQTVRYKIQLANSTPSPIPKRTEVVEYLKSFSYNATALDTYLRCQLKFYYRYVLNLQERDEVTGEVDQADIGTFVHSVLAKYFAQLRGKTLTNDLLKVSQLDRIVDEHFKATYRDNPAGYLLRKQIRLHLNDFILQYQRPLLNQDITILDLEMKLQSTISGRQFNGTLDRVERRGEKVYVLDYKTGNNGKYTKINFKKLDIGERESWSEAIGSLQLPLYAMLYSKTTGKPLKEIVPAYLFLGKQEIDETIEQGLFDEADSSEEKFAMLEKIVSLLLNEITNIDHSFEPTAHFERECRNCAFKYICGTQWVS